MRRAFTLIEILVVISIMAVLMGFGVGMIQRAGTGNLLMQTTSTAANLIATARISAFGPSGAYVTIDTEAPGGGVMRVFRQRMVFTWHAENFEDASELDILKREGSAEVVSDAAVPSPLGNHVQFDGGSRVILQDRPWQHFRDGFSLEFSVNIDKNSTRQRMRIFQKAGALEVNLISGEGGRWGVEAKIVLSEDEAGEGAGWHVVKTGERGATQVIEWANPILAGRWTDIRIAYDRDEFTIQIDDSVRGMRKDKKNAMKPAIGDRRADLIIGDSYQGGFDTLVIGGIYEDDDDRYFIADLISRVDAAGKRLVGRVAIHFLNRQLDPRHHSEPIEMIFQLGQDGDGMVAAKRSVLVSLSGESFVKRPGE